MDLQPKPRTISELAAQLGVSSMTVHRAIAGKPDVAPATRTRILEEIERLGWRPNIAARGLRQGKTFTLGILVSNVAASFLPEVLLGLNRTAEDRGYHTIVSVHEHEMERAERHLHTMQSKGVDGLVYYPTETGGEVGLLNEIRRTTPVVVVMREIRGFSGPSVVVDDRLGGKLAAEHLLALGHRRIGFIGYRDNWLSEARREGCRAALEARGLILRPEWTAADLNPGEERARDAAAAILSLPERPTALFCASDRLAARALQAAHAMGLRVPDQLSVIGYNNDPLASLLPVPLTTVAQPRAEVGERAAEMALAEGPALEPSRDGDGGTPARIVLKPWLVRRVSTAAVSGDWAAGSGSVP